MGAGRAAGGFLALLISDAFTDGDAHVTGVTIEQHSNGCSETQGWVDGQSMGKASGATTPEVPTCPPRSRRL